MHHYAHEGRRTARKKLEQIRNADRDEKERGAKLNELEVLI